MSNRYQTRSPLLSGVDFSKMTGEDLKAAFLEMLNAGIHGISFSVYLNDQAPGSQISAQQIRERMQVIKPYVKWIRSFSCTDGNEQIPRIGHENGLKTLVGAWLGSDAEKNEREIEAVIKVAQAGHADIVAVGNEVLLRGDLSEDQLIGLIHRVKQAIPGIPVGYVDAYYEFAVHPRVSDACDVILANCYPFWEGYPFEHSLAYLKGMYQTALSAGRGKKVIVTETGWPNLGSAERAALPSYENAMRYFINTYTWAAAEQVEVFYFSSFDELWKVGAEGDVGAYWGLWDIDGNLKYR